MDAGQVVLEARAHCKGHARLAPRVQPPPLPRTPWPTLSKLLERKLFLLVLELGICVFGRRILERGCDGGGLGLVDDPEGPDDLVDHAPQLPWHRVQRLHHQVRRMSKTPSHASSWS